MGDAPADFNGACPKRRRGGGREGGRGKDSGGPVAREKALSAFPPSLPLSSFPPFLPPSAPPFLPPSLTFLPPSFPPSLPPAFVPNVRRVVAVLLPAYLNSTNSLGSGCSLAGRF